MSVMTVITPENVNEIFSYNEETGILTWKERPSSWFSKRCSCLTWNARYAGRETGTIGRHGYSKVMIKGRSYMAHRVIWLMKTGEWPVMDMDHINRIRNDNRWENLRLATRSENGRNRGINKNNKSGVTGVYYHRNREVSVSHIRALGRQITLGYYKDKFEAICARKSAENKYGYSAVVGGL
jgi:hypothetical protein